MGHNHELRCCVEAPGDYAVKAKYALSMLLIPLGCIPKWVQREALEEGGIYYGPSSAQVTSEAIRIPLHSETIVFFQRRSIYPLSNTVWRTWENERWPILFGGPEEHNQDIIASTFFWLSGWQEYTVRNRDFHGRFSFEASLQAKLGIGGMPCVDAYREWLAHRIEASGVDLNRRTWTKRGWAFCPTHDIDYIRKWRPGMIYREVVQYLIGNQLKQSVPGRINRFARFLKDWIVPGDVFKKALTRMTHETEKRGGKGTYFFKTDAHGPRDVYYPISHRFVKRTFNWLKANDFEIGLHPSYYAYNHAGYLQDEKKRLEAAANLAVKSVRQHYLRYETRTSQLHLEEGFSIDSTLAFADQEGFRRGTCLPFKLFDIQENKILSLWEMPLCVMDGTVFNYRGYSLEEAVETTIQLMQWCKRFGGVCVGLWHNMLWDELDFPGWGEHFIASIDYAVNEGAYIGTLKDSLAMYLNSDV